MAVDSSNGKSAALKSIGANVAVALVRGPEHEVVFANTAFIDSFSSDVGKKLVEGVIPLEATLLFEKAWETGKPQAIRRYRMVPAVDHDPTYWHCDIMPLPVEGAERTALVIARETTKEVELAGELVEKDRLLDLIMTYVPWGILVASDRSRIERISEHGAGLFEWPRETYEGKSLADIMSMPRVYNSDGKEVEPANLPVARAINRGEVILGEEWLIADATGRRRKTILCNAAPIRGAHDEVIGGITTFGDITEIKNVMHRLRDLVAEKEVLLRELHHRVKNSLQMVASLTLMEKVQNPEAAALCDRLIGRVEAIGKVHEILGSADDVSRVDFSSYVNKFTADILNIYSDIALNITVIGNIKIPLDVATPLILIINELISNSIKYSFMDRAAGHISISLELIADGYLLTIGDDGVGGVPANMPKSLGLRLVDSLLRQLGATMQVNSVPGEGTTWRVRFPHDLLARTVGAESAATSA